MSGWFLERALNQALELAADPHLAVSARSKPESEVRSQGCALGMIVLLLGATSFLVIVAILAGAGTEEEPRRTIIMLAVLALAGLVLSSLLKGWRERSRRAAYVDPGLVIEAGPEGVTIAGPRGRHFIRYAEVRARINSIAFRQSVLFVGISMDSPLGEFSLDDALFANGRHVAAMVVRGMHEARGRGGAGGG